MTKTKWMLPMAVVLLLVLGGFLAAKMFIYPKAQITQAMNNVAPDFTLPDAMGKPFTLSSQRGHRVVLYFYRGYW